MPMMSTYSSEKPPTLPRPRPRGPSTVVLPRFLMSMPRGRVCEGVSVGVASTSGNSTNGVGYRDKNKK